MAKRSRKAPRRKKGGGASGAPAAPAATAAPPAALTDHRRAHYAGLAKVHDAKAIEHATQARVYRELAGG